MKKYLSSFLFLVLFSILLLFSSTAEAVKVKLEPIVKDTFDTYTDNSVVGQGGWASYANGANFIVTTIKHGKAIHNISIGDSVITKTGTSLTDGKQAVYVKTENRSNWGLYPDGNAQVRLSKGQSFASSIFIAASVF